MAVSAASALNVTGTDTDAIDYSTASWTPTTGKVYLLAFALLDLGSARTLASAWTVSGNNMTWTRINGAAGGATQPGMGVFIAYADGTQTTGATTIAGVVTSGQTADGAIWGIAELSGSSQSAANAVVQSGNDAVTADSISVTLSSFGSANNATCAWVLSYDDASTTGPAITAGSGFAITTGLNASQAAGGDGMRLAFEFRNDNDTGVDATAVAANDRMLIVAMEIKALVTASGTATVAGSGAVAATGIPTRSRTATVAGSGAVAASGYAVRSRTATVAGAGAVAGAGTRVASRTATLAGAGALSATGVREALRTGSLAGSGSLAGTGVREASRSATVAGSGVIEATGSVEGAPEGAAEEEARFGGTPYTRRELDRLIWEEQLVRLLREDEELLCLV